MKYKGSCHCGQIKFEVDMKIEKLLSCNCSICSKKGHLLSFIKDENFKLLSGSDAITDYQFGKKKLHHSFCKVCGIGVFGRGKAPDGALTRAINVRCLDGIDVKQFDITEYDGKSL